MAIKRILIFALLLAATANATNYYVSPWGDNSDGSTWAKAWRHPNSTNDGMNGNDTVFIAPGTYDSTYILPDAGNVYACSTLTAIDILRSTTRLRGSTALPSGTWVNRSGNIWRYSVTLGSRWSAFTSFSTTGWILLMRDGTMQHSLDASSGGQNLSSLDAATEYLCDPRQYNDSLFVYSTTNPNGSAWRYAQNPVVLFGNSDDNVTFIGLTIEEGYQGVMLIGSDAITTDQPDSLLVSHCNLWNTNHVMSAGNLGLIFASGFGTTWTSTQNGEFNHLVADSFDYAWCPSDDLSGGAGLDAYSQRKMTIDSCYFGPNLRAGGLMFKNGGAHRTTLISNNVIAHNTFEGIGSTTQKAHIWIAQLTDSLLIYGNTFKNARYRAIDFHSTGSNAWSVGRIKVFNNTFFNCGGNSGPAIIFTQRFYDSTGANEVRYNAFYDTATVAGQIWFQDQGEQSPSSTRQSPEIETCWDIDSNMYYTGSSAFVTQFTSGATCTGTDSVAWRACGFDVNGRFKINPNFANTSIGDFSRPSSSAEMSRTYGGKTWTRWGAWQPGNSIADTCIQITGKTTLALSDTCYCIVDSLRYTFAQWDTLIHTGGHDNIRIWGYHSGGGRGIIGYSASDTGSNATVTDLQKGSVVLHVAGSDNVLIKNLAIVPRAIDDSVRGIVGINVLTVDGINCDNDSVVAGGFSSRAYQQSTTGGNRSFDQLLQNSYFGTVSKGYHRRDALYGATVKFVTSVLKSDRYSANYTYAYKVRNCRIHTIHTGIGSAGFTVDTTPNPDDTLYPLIYIDSNTITVDTRNDLFMTYDDNDVNNSAGDPYGIGVDGVDRGSRITGNSISSMASTHYGGDGMLLQHIDATVDTPFAVYNNTFALQHGAHPRIAEGRQAVVGTYIRNYDANYFVKGLWYHHNYGYLVVDEDTGTTYAGRYGECVRMGFENGANGNVIEKNHFTLIPRDSLTRTGAGGLEVSGLTFEQHDSTNSAGDAGTGNNVARYNYWRVPRNPIWLGGTRIGIGADNVLIIGDTCNTIYDGDSTFVRFHQSGTYYSHSINNNLQDMVLQGYANTSDVIKGTVTASADQWGKQLSYLRSVTVNLKNVASANVNGGTMWAVDAYGHRFDMPATNASGNSSDTLRWRFFGYDALPADGYVVADSNSYNNFTFWGKSGSDSASTSATINWTTSQLINVQLTSSAPSSYQIIKGTIFKQGPVIK